MHSISTSNSRMPHISLSLFSTLPLLPFFRFSRANFRFFRQNFLPVYLENYLTFKREIHWKMVHYLIWYCETCTSWCPKIAKYAFNFPGINIAKCALIGRKIGKVSSNFCKFHPVFFWWKIVLVRLFTLQPDSLVLPSWHFSWSNTVSHAAWKNCRINTQRSYDKCQGIANFFSLVCSSSLTC